MPPHCHYRQSTRKWTVEAAGLRLRQHLAVLVAHRRNRWFTSAENQDENRQQTVRYGPGNVSHRKIQRSTSINVHETMLLCVKVVKRQNFDRGRLKQESTSSQTKTNACKRKSTCSLRSLMSLRACSLMSARRYQKTLRSFCQDDGSSSMECSLDIICIKGTFVSLTSFIYFCMHVNVCPCTYARCCDICYTTLTLTVVYIYNKSLPLFIYEQSNFLYVYTLINRFTSYNACFVSCILLAVKFYLVYISSCSGFENWSVFILHDCVNVIHYWKPKNNGFACFIDTDLEEIHCTCYKEDPVKLGCKFYSYNVTDVLYTVGVGLYLSRAFCKNKRTQNDIVVCFLLNQTF
ncbi:hypothetical protein MAR_026560 [Mya arenaria]|uniref:Uncharacterized protein n=1 Tax=Mya arenaria TaxID=6604 RepID=A0ABY7EQW6_MYAAR|nr:hypothetical protein MAR_026560 [Mya arenaria]